MNVSVVTVTYGDRSALLKEVVTALSGIQESAEITRLLVVDNGSSPATQEYLCELKQCEPRAQVVHLAENMGSAAGFKAGLEAALETDCDYIWLLDDDNRPEPTALAELLKVAEREPGAALLSLRTDREAYVKYAKSGNLEWAFGYPNSFLGFSWRDIPHKRMKHDALSATPSDFLPSILPIPYASYGGLFLKREHLSRIGFPREELYLYGDDHEYTHRLVTAGIPLYLVPTSRTADVDHSWSTHTGDESFFRAPYVLLTSDESRLQRIYLGVRNHILFESRELLSSPWEYALNLLLYLSLLGGLSVTAVFVKRSRHPLRGYLTVLRATYNGLTGNLK